MLHVAALLAAGVGSRFVGPTHKLTADLRGRQVWQWALDQVLDAGFDHVVVVTGAVELAVPASVTTVTNPLWALGQATSLHAATAAAGALGADSVTIGLADQPFVTAEAWRAVRDAPPGCRIVLAEYEGHPGPHPVRLGRDVWPMLPTEGDEGARRVIHLHPEWVCRVPCVGSVADIDTLEDLERWKNC